MGPEDTSGSNLRSAINVERPPYLHEKEIRDATRVVSLIAGGRNPFSEEPFERLRPDQRDAVLRALCIVVSAADRSERHEPAQGETWLPSGDAAKSGTKRPLEQYLRAVEREAILEALKETKFNRTAAAKLLGITFRALRYRMEILGLEKGDDE